jgi:hypothetical protein
VNRKHRSEMSTKEIAWTEKLVHGVREWNFAVDHVLERMAEKGITKQALLDTLRYGEVIEVNSRGRVVMRLRVKLNPTMQRGTCVVISVRDKVLVTAWYNSERDHHNTLDRSEYGWNVDVITYLESL